MRPEGVADAQTVEIPSPPKELSMGTHHGGWREKPCVFLRRPYRKPTQVGRKKILRPTGEGLLRNSAN